MEKIYFNGLLVILLRKITSTNKRRNTCIFPFPAEFYNALSVPPSTHQVCDRSRNFAGSIPGSLAVIST